MAQPKTPSMASIKAFIRKEGPRFLKKSNITSIGIGYKIKDGKQTNQISVQFTVGRKVAPEHLESLAATLLPESVTIDGVALPTDVIERNYEPGARKIKVKPAAARKIAVDPIVPGVSIGHYTISAGTAGCVVYDAQSGAPYVLSNWHVLCGPEGKPGDAIVQPGSYDDDRIERNRAGTLVRSYLGIAGDCAVASIQNRRLEGTILDLDVAVGEIGEPALNDRVVKSGRTTDVTYGIVKRIHTIVRIGYDEAGEKEIGCFEIGPDPAHPAANDEISMGGDSGSAWLHVADDKPDGMMLGLHFAGETGDEPDHALACYAGSVFHKLNILPAPPAQVVVTESPLVGFNATFIGDPIPLPLAATQEVREDLLAIDGKAVVDYMHFSLALSRERRFARWVAWNVDGGAIRKLSRKGLNFKKDPRVPAKAQVGNELYANNPLDRGHIARRADLIWGTLPEARQANVDSFFYTNITPQHEDFNQSAAHGIWGELENAVFEDVDVEDLRISVVGGPIFSDSDPVYRGVKLPKQFWKVIYFKEMSATAITAKGYVLTQAELLNELEVLELPQFSVYEVPLDQIGAMIGLDLAMPAESKAKKKNCSAESLASVKVRRIGAVKEIIGQTV
jgi:endonuclease G